MSDINTKLAAGREYRNTDRMEARAAETQEETSYIVEGYACTFNQPYVLYHDGSYTVREQIDPAAFDACDMGDVIMQYDHNGRVFARTSNDTLKLDIDEHGLHVVADLSGTEAGRQLADEIRGGYTCKMSFGFVVEEDKREETWKREDNACEILRTITKIAKLYDVSAVSLPANDATEISARVYGEGVIAACQQEIADAEQRSRDKKRALLNILLEV